MSAPTPPDAASLTPARIVAELDRHVVGQSAAKRAVAVAIRNRWRRLQLPADLRREVQPRNILLIGSTGVGKTEIARRIADLIGAPFTKVEATKYTEVGYVGRDVESIVRDLLDTAIAMVRSKAKREVEGKAREQAEARVLDALVASWQPGDADLDPFGSVPPARAGTIVGAPPPATPPMQNMEAVRVRLRERLRSGALDAKPVTIDVRESRGQPLANIFSDPAFQQPGMDLGKLMEKLHPPTTRSRRLTVREAIDALSAEEAEGLVDGQDLNAKAIELVEEGGIVFLDEIDKVTAREGASGADVSREGVQRDLLPLIEGTIVSTRHGAVRTDHILFIAAGAFHIAKPSDLLPELQGRLPIRVRLDDLTEADFVRILEEPQGALTRQITALLGTEGVRVTFTADGVREIARVAARANASQENIGARRLATVVERIVEEISFEAPGRRGERVEIDAAYVRDRVGALLADEDLSAYVL